MFSAERQRQVFTVAQVNRYTRALLESDALLCGLFIEGEISNFHAHQSGHFYFTLKDADAAIGCVMFQSHTDSIAFTPKNGMKVIAFGRLSLYEKTGQYQFYTEHMELAGIGGLQLAFMQLCEKLQAEGLFEADRKRPLPSYPACVAVITSPTGAAVQDIIRVMHQRNPAVQIVIAPATVQGRDAAADITRAIAEVNEWGRADVIIVGRGGGSIEDLWAFNEEITARAVAASKIPIISAVGHETDFTVCDFVADARAATPTAAAQMAVYDLSQLTKALHQITNELHEAAKNIIRDRHADAQHLLNQLTRQTQLRLTREKEKIAHAHALLEKVSPYAAFKRGFAQVRRTSGELVITSAALQAGAQLQLQWADGRADVEVLATHTN